MTIHDASPSRWGRARFGGGTAALIGVSLGSGALLSAAAGGTFAALGGSEQPALALAVVFICTLPVTAALCWAILVDRSSVKGAIERPDDSIESAWYGKAASGTFGDVLLVGGLGATAFAFVKIEAQVSWVLAAVVLFAMLDFTVRFLWVKRTS